MSWVEYSGNLFIICECTSYDLLDQCCEMLINWRMIDLLVLVWTQV